MNYITNRHHTFENGYIALQDLRLAGLPDKISIDGEILPIQLEHHISLVCTKKLAPLVSPDDVEGTEQRFIAAFQKFESEQHMSEYKLTDEFYIVELDDRKSVVIKCEVPHLEELFRALRADFSYDFPTQVPHITLYARQNAGIGLLSADELSRIAKRIELPELRDIIAK